MNGALRIGIDYTAALQQRAGIGRIVREQIRALAQIDSQTTYRLFSAGSHHTTLPPSLGPNFTWSPTRVSNQWLARIWHRARLPLPVEFFSGPLDLFHATDFVLPPTLPKTQTIVTVHDLTFVRVPDAAPPRLRTYLNAVVPRSLKRANHIIADSHATKDDIVALYKVPLERISVVWGGVSPDFRQIHDEVKLKETLQKYALGQRPFLFSVGTVQPRKNYGRLVRSLEQVHREGLDVDLVIAGGKGWLEDEMYETIRDLNMGDYVRLVGYVSDNDLPYLYNASTCVVFPSLYEGFGFPVLEAMACGIPVVTSNTSSLPEIAGDAALLVDPYNVEELTTAIVRTLIDDTLRHDLTNRGIERASQFSWRASAERLHTTYMQVLSG